MITAHARRRPAACEGPNDLGRRRGVAAGQRQERRRRGPDQAFDLALEGPGGDAQLDDPGEQITSEPSHGLGPTEEGRAERGLDDGPPKRARRGLGDGQLDEEPAQALLVARPFATRSSQ